MAALSRASLGDAAGGPPGRPTRFVHLFEFADEAAHQAHGSSDAVRQFEAVYGPELVGGPVVFTDYVLIATNRGP